MIKKILFVCKGNIFRSKVAEIIFNKLNKNKKIKTKSAGIASSKETVSQCVQKTLLDLGYKKTEKKPRKLTNQMLKWADLIIIPADNINLDVLGKKVIQWKISDTKKDDYKGILKRVRP